MDSQGNQASADPDPLAAATLGGGPTGCIPPPGRVPLLRGASECCADKASWGAGATTVVGPIFKSPTGRFDCVNSGGGSTIAVSGRVRPRVCSIRDLWRRRDNIRFQCRLHHPVTCKLNFRGGRDDLRLGRAFATSLPGLHPEERPGL